MARRKLKKAVTLAATVKGVKTHDRRALDVPTGARVAVVVVDDPGEIIYLGRGLWGRAPASDEKLTVVRNIRHDPLADMQNAGHIDECQYLAGRHWQRAWELSQGRSVQAMDPSKDVVDGGQIAQSTLTNAQIKAFGEIARAMTDLGMIGESLVKDVLGENLSILQCAMKRGQTSEAARKFFGQRFRECLDTLAVTFGYAGKPT
jgi:hypothetical protein